MRIFGMMVMMMFFGGLALAATVNLNNGSSIQGDIIKQDSKSLQVNVDGVTMTYYADEIKDVDGQPFGSGATPPAGQAAAQPADTAAPAVQTDTATPSADNTSPAAAPQADASAQTADTSTPAPSTQPDVNTQPADNTAPDAQPQSADQTSTPAPAATGDMTDQTAPASTDTGGTSDSIDPDKKALILKFIDVFGTRQALINNFETMIQQIEKDKPDEAQKIRERVKVDEIIDRLLPIYDRNFSSDDLKAFIAFYGSDEGQKLITTIPELMKESVQESVKYMQEKFPEVKQGDTASVSNT